jgi:hypothetical protein
VRLDLPAETTADLDADPAFVLNVGAIPAQRRVILPLRTVVWLHEYLGLTAHLQGSQCSNWLILALIYPGMLTTQRPGGARPPGPLAAFGLDESIYDDVVVNNETNKLSASIVFFLLAHELGHIALRHATGATGIHSQLQETRADAYALDAMANVGLAPFGLAIFFSAAAMMEGVQNTHPLSGSRVDAALRDFEARPLAFVDRSEQDPESWLPRLKKLSREVREAIPLADDPERRAGILKIAAGADFPRLREIQEFACRG